MIFVEVKILNRISITDRSTHQSKGLLNLDEISSVEEWNNRVYGYNLALRIIMKNGEEKIVADSYIDFLRLVQEVMVAHGK